MGRPLVIACLLLVGAGCRPRPMVLDRSLAVMRSFVPRWRTSAPGDFPGSAERRRPTIPQRCLDDARGPGCYLRLRRRPSALASCGPRTLRVGDPPPTDADTSGFRRERVARSRWACSPEA
ncbi:MAG: hypothetical protein NT062_17495 [Proteobacteria bacterium]|nr:hypothetical protein [Pseudomonadota bacterium]